MGTQLIMFDSPIIVSDEKIEVGNWCFDKINCLYKQETDKIFELFTGSKKIIAGLPELPSIDFNGFEEQLGIVDIEKLALLKYPKHTFADNEYGDDLSPLCRMGFIEGFKAAQEPNEKKFSLEDVRKAFKEGLSYSNKHYHDYSEDLFIQSLSQPKVFDIEIEMEDKGGYRQDSMNGFWISKLVPKITNNSIKIIKIL